MLKRSPASFVIRLTGKGVSPELVPLRALSDAASAITRLAIGEIEDGEGHSVRVLDVKRGSAVYPCLMESEHETEANLRKVGEVIRNPESDLLTYQMLQPIRQLTTIASKLKCDIRIESPKDRLVFATVDPEAYKRIRGVALIHDEATVNGFLVRVDGATDKKCSLRVHGRDRLLYCDVASRELSRQLGRHLYEPVTVHGRGLYFSRTWELLKLRITRATFPPTSDYNQMIAEMRELGCDAWDDVEDVDEEIRTMR